MNKKMSYIEDEITDICSRFLKDNILIHNYAFTQDDDLAVSMPHIIKSLLGVDV